MAGILILDLIVPADIDFAALYVVPIALGAAATLSKRLLWAATAVAAVFTLLGLVAAPPPTAEDVWYPVYWVNRAIVVVSLIALSAVAHVWIEARQRGRRAEAALRESEQRLRATYEHASVGIGETDPATGRFVRVNDRYAAITGYAPEELLERTIADLTDPADVEADLANYRRQMAGETDTYQLEKRYRRKDGRTEWVELSASVVREETGRPLYGVRIVQDISERKRVQEALQQLADTLEQRVASEIGERLKTEAALHQAQKMEAVGQLTGGVAHDFNNLLTAVVGYIEMIESAAADNPRVRQLAAAALRSLERGARLNASLLAFSGKQRLRIRTADVNALLEEILPLLCRAVGEGVRVGLSLEPALRAGRFDPAQLEAAVLNLAINARDAMRPAGGRLTIATRNASLGPADLAGNGDAAAGQFVAVAVEDTGCGMPPEVQQRCFEPFYTTKEVGQGTGLGLSQIHGFVRQSGGHVAIDSAPGRGTRVTLYLPMSEDDVAAAPVEEAAPGADASPVSADVLVVEDDEHVRMAACAALEQIGCRVRAAGDGREARAILERGEAIDLLFSDVMMPNGLNGVELARAARSRRPGLKVLLTSGYAAVVEQHAAVGEFEVLAKPYRRADLAARVRAVLAGRPSALRTR